MANWAVVIGIDQYSMANISLKGAVRDALRMREWLLTGGDVPDSNMFMMLSPSPTSPSTTGITFDEPTRDNIIDVIATKLLPRSNGKGERFFFYYSGHGLSNRVNFNDEDAIIAKDFSLLHSDKSFSLSSIRNRFKATQFLDQFFIIDACRNFPRTTDQDEFRTGDWPRPKKIDAGVETVQQFVFYATSPGVKAVELDDLNNERGAFTDVLMDGLLGKGRAKAWDVANQQYIVRVDRLFEYVLSEVKKKRLAVPIDAERERFQVPRLDGERGGDRDSNPILAQFDPQVQSILNVSLDVQIDPFKVESLVDVTVERDGTVITNQKQVAQLPVTFSLPPKEYSLRATAVDQDPKQKRWSVELYDPQELQLTMIPKAIAPSPTFDTRDISFGDPDPPGGGGGMRAASLADNESEEVLSDLRFDDNALLSDVGRLIVETSDPLAALEITDSTGLVIDSGEGQLDIQDLSPGFYRVRLQTPEDPAVEQLIDLSSGEIEKITLNVPPQKQSELTKEIVEAADFLVRDDNTLEVSSSIGPATAVQLSTILMLAGHVVNKGQAGGQRLRSLGFKSFQATVRAPAKSGLQILAAVEPDSSVDVSTYISRINLRVWPFEEDMPEKADHMTSLSTIASLAEFAKSTQPGPHWLSIEMPGQAPVAFALAMLTQRLTMIVLHLNSENQVRVFQYSSDMTDEDLIQPKMLRRVELMQRFYFSGRLEYASHQAEFLHESSVEEPIAGCLAGYLSLRLHETEELGAIANKMIDLYPNLADSYVLKAEHAASQRELEAAKTACLSALDQGLPIFADGLAILYDNLSLYNLEHPRGQLLLNVFEHRVRNPLWTSWLLGSTEIISGKQQ